MKMENRVKDEFIRLDLSFYQPINSYSSVREVGMYN